MGFFVIEFRICAKACWRLVPFVEAMENLANRLGGDGGGHPGAAGWTGICDEVELESIIMANLADGVIK